MSATDHTLTAPERENIEELLRLHVLADDEQIVYDLFETLLTQRGVTYEARLATAEAEKEALRAESSIARMDAERYAGKALEHHARAEAAEAALTGLVAAVSELADQHWDWKAGRVLHGHLRALLDAYRAAALRAREAKALRDAASDLAHCVEAGWSSVQIVNALYNRADSIEQARP